MTLAIDLCERGILPDPLTRFGMRRLLARRLRAESAGTEADVLARYERGLAELRKSPVAVAVDKANEQHYELPADFFRIVLGPHLKYSACLWENGTATLGAAEAAMLRLTCERAMLRDGQRILELGCGWGSLTLWMGEHYPTAQITAVSNSASQRAYIMSQAAQRGLHNVRVVTADANVFATEERFDRVVSVEMFEHMRNYEQLMARIAEWLQPGGKLFVHIFCHRELMYPFTAKGEYDWMAEHFFTGGLMPSVRTLTDFQRDLQLEEQWEVSGLHYERTCNAWLARLDARRDEVKRVFAGVYPRGDVDRWVNRWRMFFMACAELFGYRGGDEWLVAHYRFGRSA